MKGASLWRRMRDERGFFVVEGLGMRGVREVLRSGTTSSFRRGAGGVVNRGGDFCQGLAQPERRSRSATERKALCYEDEGALLRKEEGRFAATRKGASLRCGGARGAGGSS
jgi:hypothetical protein